MSAGKLLAQWIRESGKKFYLVDGGIFSRYCVKLENSSGSVGVCQMESGIHKKKSNNADSDKNDLYRLNYISSKISRSNDDIASNEDIDVNENIRSKTDIGSKIDIGSNVTHLNAINSILEYWKADESYQVIWFLTKFRLKKKKCSPT